VWLLRRRYGTLFPHLKCAPFGYSLRYAECAVAAGVDAQADVWMGMSHGFPGRIGRLKAAAQALDAVAAFLECASNQIAGRPKQAITGLVAVVPNAGMIIALNTFLDSVGKSA
jgi:hypothetical protein